MSLGYHRRLLRLTVRRILNREENGEGQLVSKMSTGSATKGKQINPEMPEIIFKNFINTVLNKQICANFNDIELRHA